MKTVWLAVVATLAATLLAVALSGGSAQATTSNQPHAFTCNALVNLVVLCKNNVDTTITIGDVTVGDVSILGGKITGIDGDITIAKVQDVLSNNHFKCTSIVIAIVNKPDLNGVCNGPN